MAVPQAPADASGGFMTIQANNGTDTHRLRVHLLPFSLTSFVVSGTPETYGDDDGHHNYAYVPNTPAGAEMGVSDTFAALCAKLAPIYATTWTFELLNLYQNNSNVLTEVFPTPVVTPVPGSEAGSSTPTGIARAVEAILNMKSTGGGRARVVITAWDQNAAATVPANMSSTSGPTAWAALISYLSGANTGVVARDGHKLANAAHVTYVINRRLRRKYGYA